MVGVRATILAGTAVHSEYNSVKKRNEPINVIVSFLEPEDSAFGPVCGFKERPFSPELNNANIIPTRFGSCKITVIS